MSDSNTKQKILDASIRLFNEKGMASVRLQQIADDIGISTGNLAYHYRNKEAIIEAFNAYLQEEFAQVLHTYRIFPNLMDFDHQLSQYFDLLQKYPGCFLDMVEMGRSYPDLLKGWRSQITKMINQIRKRFDFNQQRGIIMPEPRPGIYDTTSNAIWVIIQTWVSQQVIKGTNWKSCEKCFKEMVWDQMFPFFTEAGRAEFENLIVPILKALPSPR